MNKKILLIGFILLLVLQISAQKDKSWIKYKFGDTFFVEYPVMISGLDYRVVLRDVQNIDDVISLVDTLNIKKSYKKILRSFDNSYFKHIIRLHNILYTTNSNCQVKGIYDYVVLNTYNYDGLKIELLEPCYIMDFYFSKKSEHRYTHPSRSDGKKFIFGYWKLAILFDDRSKIVCE